MEAKVAGGCNQRLGKKTKETKDQETFGSARDSSHLISLKNHEWIGNTKGAD